MRNEFIFDGVYSSQFAVYISGKGTYNGTQREVEQIAIPGRNGLLNLDQGRYANIELTYPAFIYRDFDTNFSALRAFLLSRTGYKRLTDTYHADEFRLARYTGEIQPNLAQFNHVGSFDITFDCMPQRFLKSGEIAVSFTKDGGIDNPTLFTAKPVIRVYGSGSIGVGSETITIAQHSYTYIDIDTDIQDCYFGSTNCNGLVTITGDTFPSLEPGTNGITLDSVSRVEITPRWYTL